MKDNHTPQKESRLKKPQKIARKSLNTAFTTVSEDVSSETSKELSVLSAISETSDANIGSQTPQSALSSLSPAPSEAFPLSEPFQTPKVSTTSVEPVDVSTERCIFHKPDGSIEVDVLSEILKQARSQVLNSTDVDQKSKKLLDALIMAVSNECFALPEESSCCSELVSAKGWIAFLCCLLWSFIVYFILFDASDHSYIGALPT